VIVEKLGDDSARITAVKGEPAASMPTPIDEATGICPILTLYWEPTDEEPDPNHDVYLDTDFNDVRDANRASHGNVQYYSENQEDPNYTPPTLQLNTTYYWRVDEVNTVDGTVYDTYPVVWQFTTADGNASAPDPPDGRRGVNPADVVLRWTPSCVATAQDVYFSADFDDVNTMQPTAIEDTVSATDNNCPVGTLDTYTSYYWRIKTDTGGDGKIWEFRTGLGGLLLEMLFEGTPDANLPATVTDTSSNLLEFTTYSALYDPCADGSVKYGDGRYTGTSADFDPCAGLYSIHFWVKPTYLSGTDMDDIQLVGKSEGTWLIQINDPGSGEDRNNSFKIYHTGESVSTSDDSAEEDEWAHIAVVYDQPDLDIYLNGAWDDSESRSNPAPADNNHPVGIGCRIRPPEPNGTYRYDQFFEGRIDELRIWDIVVLPVLECTSEPYPPDGSRFWDPNDPNLDTFTWKPGAYAATSQGHKIYFGDSMDDVNESADPCATLDSNSWTHSETFEIGKTYYWRVDEVNENPWAPAGSPWTGPIWKFQTQAELYDPNIVVYYPLDETSGDDVFDYSGRYFDAECDDAPHWEPNNGRYGGCMHFSMEWGWDDDDEEWDWMNDEPGNIETVSDYGAQMADMINKEISISVWVNGDPNQRSDDDMVVFEFCDDDYDDGIEDEPDGTKILRCCLPCRRLPRRYYGMERL
jgi:hypothetical protein